MMVVLREDAGQHTEARRTWETVFRSLQRPEAGGLRVSLLHRLRPVDLHTASGVYVGQRLAVDVDLERIERVIKRIVKGLFFREMGRRLPDTHEATAMTDPRFLPGEETMASLRSILAALRAQPVREIGKGVFSYRFVVAADQPDATVWLLCFFEGLWTIGVTLPQGELDSSRTTLHSG